VSAAKTSLTETPRDDAPSMRRPKDRTGLHDVPRTAVLRLRAFVNDRDRLWALAPCYGWMQVGRFEEDGTLIGHLDAELRRVPREREGLLSEHPHATTFLDDFFVCRESDVPPGAPAPPPRPTAGE
jgi:hypothetical protein